MVSYVTPHRVAIVLGCCAASCIAQPSWEQNWQQVMAKNGGYDATRPPPSMGNPKPLTVQFGYSVKSFNYDFVKAELNVHLWVRMYWKDERLLYNGPALFGDNYIAGESYVPAVNWKGDNPNIWLPDIACYYSKDGYAGLQTHGVGVQVFPQEHNSQWNVFMAVPVQMTVHC